VLVVEAALRSGSLITARMALEQNREVFALPHSIYHPLGRGCHHLIGQGAKLVQTVDDVVEELLPGLGSAGSQQAQQHPVSACGDTARRVYNSIGYEPFCVDDLVALTDCDAGSVMAALMELELAGLVDVRDGLYMRS